MNYPAVVDIGLMIAFGRSDKAEDRIRHIHFNMRAPHGHTVSGPSPNPYYQQYGAPGHVYSMRPDLTRSGGVILLGKASPLLVPIVLAGANIAVIRNAPQERQQGMWQMFASGLTGTFGVGSGVKL